jgi:hypothetical protein
MVSRTKSTGLNRRVTAMSQSRHVTLGCSFKSWAVFIQRPHTERISVFHGMENPCLCVRRWLRGKICSAVVFGRTSMAISGCVAIRCKIPGYCVSIPREGDCRQSESFGEWAASSLASDLVTYDWNHRITTQTDMGKVVIQSRCTARSLGSCLRQYYRRRIAHFIKSPFFKNLPFFVSSPNLSLFNLRMRSQAPTYPSFTWVLTDPSNPSFSLAHHDLHPCSQRDLLRPYITQRVPPHNDLMVIIVFCFLSFCLLNSARRKPWIIEMKHLPRRRSCLPYVDTFHC